MVMRKNRVLFLNIILLLAGCNSSEELEIKLVGTWEGAREDSVGSPVDHLYDDEKREYIWCVSYHEEDNRVELAIKSTQLITSEGESPRFEPQLELYEGYWSVLPGARIKNLIVPLGTLGVRNPDGDFPLAKTERYIVESIDERKMRYRAESNDDVWFLNKRVESCSDKFSLQAANPAALSSEDKTSVVDQ